MSNNGLKPCPVCGARQNIDGTFRCGCKKRLKTLSPPSPKRKK